MIRDIALIALHLAHGADDDLQRREVDEIAARLEAWRTDNAELTVLAAMKEATDTYVHAESETALGSAIERVRDLLDPASRARLLDDLTAVAHADNRLLENERVLLDTLRAQWKVGPATQPQAAPEA